MNTRLRALLRTWALQDSNGEDSLFAVNDAVQYLAKKVFDDYEPSQFDRFEDRLDRWLGNVESETDKQSLFKLLHHLFFVGRPEFESLCRAALHGPITRWLVDTQNLDIADPTIATNISAAISDTWFCPITDSMRINSFLKVNNLDGKSHRPDWRSLGRFGDPEKVRDYIKKNSIRRIVLLEDFVGSGTQMRSAVNFAAKSSFGVPILVCPLIVCPAGDRVGGDLALQYADVSYEPVMHVPENLLIRHEAGEGEPPLYSNIRDLILREKVRLAEPEPDEESRKYHGFKNTGAVIALYSNCPNNTLPIIHDQTEHWDALFPRIRRA